MPYNTIKTCAKERFFLGKGRVPNPALSAYLPVLKRHNGKSATLTGSLRANGKSLSGYQFSPSNRNDDRTVSGLPHQAFASSVSLNSQSYKSPYSALAGAKNLAKIDRSPFSERANLALSLRRSLSHFFASNPYR